MSPSWNKLSVILLGMFAALACLFIWISTDGSINASNQRRLNAITYELKEILTNRFGHGMALRRLAGVNTGCIKKWDHYHHRMREYCGAAPATAPVSPVSPVSSALPGSPTPASVAGDKATRATHEAADPAKSDIASGSSPVTKQQAGKKKVCYFVDPSAKGARPLQVVHNAPPDKLRLLQLYRPYFAGQLVLDHHSWPDGEFLDVPEPGGPASAAKSATTEASAQPSEFVRRCRAGPAPPAGHSPGGAGAGHKKSFFYEACVGQLVEQVSERSCAFRPTLPKAFELIC